MNTALVTGGAGFLGSHLCEKLLALNTQVICLDNLYTGEKKFIKHLLTNPNFTFIKHDITQPYFAKTDYIYNLACPASPVSYQKNPIKTIETSVIGTINLLKLAKETGATLLQASTSEIYGDPKEHPQQESYFGYVNPIGIRACYDEGKRCAETLCMDYHRQHNINIRLVRIFNTYGPKMHIADGRVVPNFINAALENKPLIIYGDGRQTRSFCYVDDLIQGLIAFMQLDNGFIGPMNLGNQHEITVLSLAQKIIALTESKSKIICRTKLPDDPVQRCPNIALAKKNIHWQPQIQIETGLKQTIDYFKNLLIVGKSKLIL